jgi:hypothetical protein
MDCRVKPGNDEKGGHSLTPTPPKRHQAAEADGIANTA